MLNPLKTSVKLGPFLEKKYFWASAFFHPMVKILTLKLLGSQALTSGQTQEIFVILIITNITIRHSLMISQNTRKVAPVMFTPLFREIHHSEVFKKGIEWSGMNEILIYLNPIKKYFW